MSDLGTDHPSSTHRFFIYDPEGWGFRYFDSPESRDAAKDSIIQSYLDESWDESVSQIVAGEVTHTCEAIGVQHRPEELDGEGCDGEGTYWGDHDTRCDYDLLALSATEQSAAA
jgi:hypothetical protein